MIFLERPTVFNPKFDVVSCFLEHDGRILLLHRQDYKPQGNTWSTPAGKIENGETYEEALAREMREELSLDITPAQLKRFREVYVRYDDYDFVYHMYHYPVSERPEIVINKNDHKAHLWTTPKEALGMTLIPDEDICINLFYFSDNKR